MDKLGQYIKELRISKHYSQQYVYEQTGVSDSVQKRLEHGENEKISPITLRKLADFYQVNVIDLFAIAGFIEHKDLQQYTRVFKYSELLTNAQKSNIQNEINLYTHKEE